MVQHVDQKWPTQGKDKFIGESFELIDVRGKVVWQAQIDNSKIEWDPNFRPMDMAEPRHLHCSRVASTKSGFVIEEGSSRKKTEYRVSREKSGWVVSESKPTTSSRATP